MIAPIAMIGSHRQTAVGKSVACSNSAARYTRKALLEIMYARIDGCAPTIARQNRPPHICKRYEIRNWKSGTALHRASASGATALARTHRQQWQNRPPPLFFFRGPQIAVKATRMPIPIVMVCSLVRADCSSQAAILNSPNQLLWPLETHYPDHPVDMPHHCAHVRSCQKK